MVKGPFSYEVCGVKSKSADERVRILIVEDEVDLAEQLSRVLGEAGYAVDQAADGEKAEFLGRTEGYDAVVLDLGLPKMDGLTVLRHWREAGIAMPVLVLTARGSWHEKVQGIDGGADDYMAKPFQIEEVLARLRALIRRSSGQVTPELRCGNVVLDPRVSRVTVGWRPRQAHRPRIPRLVVPDAPSRPDRLARRIDRTHLLAGFRSRFEYR